MKLNVSEVITVTVDSKRLYDCEPPLEVNEGEAYQVFTDPHQQWKDLFYSSSPDGFFNPLLLFTGRRVKHVKCFCVCWTVGENEENLFQLGSGTKKITVPDSGELLFFANDHIKFYHNNSGSIRLIITRLS